MFWNTSESLCTLIVHRLSAVRIGDQPYFLKNQKIEAAGTFDDLLENYPAYRKMASVTL